MDKLEQSKRTKLSSSQFNQLLQKQKQNNVIVKIPLKVEDAVDFVTMTSSNYNHKSHNLNNAIPALRKSNEKESVTLLNSATMIRNESSNNNINIQTFRSEKQNEEPKGTGRFQTSMQAKVELLGQATM